MSLFDLIANDMRASFQDEAVLTPCEHLIPKQDLFATNPAATALKGEARKGPLESAKMRWDVPNAIPTERLNRILWRAVKGDWAVYPKVRQAVFAPYSLELEDRKSVV